MDGDLISLKKTLTPSEMEIFGSEFDKVKKSTGIAYLLWFFLSGLAVHKFYLGKVKQGIFYLIVPWLAVLVFILGAVDAAGGRDAQGPVEWSAFGSPTVVIALLGLLAYAVWWFVDLFTLHRQVARANEEIERGIIQQVRMR